MKFDKLLNILFEIDLQRNTIINMVIRDEFTNDNGIMGLVKEGGAFKIYLESGTDGCKDFIVFFDKEVEKERKDSYFSSKTVITDDLDPTGEQVSFKLPSIFIDELESNRIKILYIQDLMTMQPIMEINEFLEA